MFNLVSSVYSQSGSIQNPRTSGNKISGMTSSIKSTSIPKNAPYVKPQSPMKSAVGQMSNQQYGRVFKRWFGFHIFIKFIMNYYFKVG